MNLETAEKTIQLDQVKSLRDSQQALLQNSYLTKKNQLEDQRNEQEVEATLNHAKSVDHSTIVEEQKQVKEQLDKYQQMFTDK